MKYITLIIGLLVVGCGEVENGAYKHRPKQTDTNESTPTTNTNEVSGTTEKPVKELTLAEKVVGEYEMKKDGLTYKLVFLDNGILEWYMNGKKAGTEWIRKWSIVDGKIHVKYDVGDIEVWRINSDRSITQIAYIVHGKREGIPKEDQDAIKKIK